MQGFLNFSLHRINVPCFHNPGEPTSDGHVTVTHQMLASIFRAFRTRSLLQSEKYVQDFSDLFLNFVFVIFIYLAKFRNKSLFCRLTLWWREMNLIGRFFGSVHRNVLNHDLQGFIHVNVFKYRSPTKL